MRKLLIQTFALFSFFCWQTTNAQTTSNFVVDSIPCAQHPPYIPQIIPYCMSGPFAVHGPYPHTISSCPVLRNNGYTYWAESYNDHRYGLAIIAYDSLENVSGVWELTGGMLIWKITSDTINQKVTFYCEYATDTSSGTITVDWSSLFIPKDHHPVLSTDSTLYYGSEKLKIRQFGFGGFAWVDSNDVHGPIVPNRQDLLTDNIGYIAAKNYADRLGFEWFGYTLEDSALVVSCYTPPKTGNPTYDSNFVRLINAAMNSYNLFMQLRNSSNFTQIISVANNNGYRITPQDTIVASQHYDVTIKRHLSSLNDCGKFNGSACPQKIETDCIPWYLGIFSGAIGRTCAFTYYEFKCDSGFVSNANGICDIDRSKWTSTPLDSSEKGCEYYSDVHCHGMNCWMCDDSLRDSLCMDLSKLTFVTVLSANQNSLPADGHYIFVYRTVDNKIYLRPYDRCLDDTTFNYESNYRIVYGYQRMYLHVRHSQLNGGWTPVWSAGELLIRNGEIWKINNESGHFKPSIESLQYVEFTLEAWKVPIYKHVLIGDYRTYRITTCTQ